MLGKYSINATRPLRYDAIFYILKLLKCLPEKTEVHSALTSVISGDAILNK